MRVRPLAAPDLRASLDLFTTVCEEGRWLATEAPVNRREIRAGWEAILSTGHGTILLAEDGPGAEPAGLALLVGRARPELGMLVAAARRGQGVGELLLRAALAWARGVGASEVVLHVFTHNTAAAALYRKHGFEERAVLRAAYPRRSGARWDAVRMVKVLEPTGPS